MYYIDLALRKTHCANIILDIYFTFVLEGVKPSVNMILLGLNLKCKYDTEPQTLHL